MLHVITALNVGGAEAMLAKLIEQGVDGMAPHILSLMTPGFASQRIAATGTPIDTLGMARSMPGALAVARLMRRARDARPDLIQGWMYHGNLAASVAALGRPGIPVVWNIRHSLSDLSNEKRSSRAVIRAGGALSRHPAAIIYNSHAAARQHEAIGFYARRTIVIPNGFDCRLFHPRDDARGRLVRMFGIDPGALIVGMVARLHPMKDHLTLVEAVRRCRRRGSDIHLLLVGEGMDMPPPALASALAAGLPKDRVTLAPARRDVPDWLSGLDLLVSASAWGEGFPNIIGEAMACGVPCVATDVGDSRIIVDSAGLIVPSRDCEALAAAIRTLADAPRSARREIGERGRARIVAHYTLAKVAADYAALYERIAQRPGRRAHSPSLPRPGSAGAA